MFFLCQVFWAHIRLAGDFDFISLVQAYANGSIKPVDNVTAEMVSVVGAKRGDG